ncbi:MAG TPA: TonB-dependent receptor [Patescibacteria group bacterium]|nr:TonB-dependent receptor [Patescibacteria group bacterium]
MNFFINTLLLLAVATPVFSQNYTVEGTVTDPNNAPLPGATIRLISLPDSVIKGTIAGREGNFIIREVSQGRFILKISSIGYAELTRNITVSNESLRLGRLQLAEQAVTSGEVLVQERRAASQQKGDTTELDAQAFKTNPDATTEDLVRKMPGVTVQNGQVQAQGEQVQQVLVDGKPFFGEDPNAALKSMPADAVDRVQIFDEMDDQSRFTGFNNGNSRKTMNIVTKANRRQGQFGRLNSGYGSDSRYRVSANLNIFDGEQRLSILAQTNNINEQNFAIEDLVGAMSSGMGGGMRGGGMRGGGMRGGMMMRGGMRGGGGGFGGGGDIGDFLVQQNGGITQTHAFGLNYSDIWAQSIKVTGSYFGNLSDNTNDQTNFRRFVLPSDTGQTYLENTLSNSRNINHRINFKIDYDIDTMNTIILRPRLSLQQNNGHNLILAVTRSNDNIVNELDNDFNSDLLGINFSNNAVFNHRFATRGRSITLNLNTTYNRNNGENNLASHNRFFSEQFTADTLNQFSEILANGWGNTSTLTYTEPIDSSSLLQFNYTNSYTKNNSDRQTFDDTLSGSPRILNMQLSNTFENIYLTNALGAGYRYQAQSLELNVDVSVQRAELNNEQFFPRTGTIDRAFTNVLPSARIRYSISQDKNFRLFYRTRTNAPSVNQLQDVVNNTNPVQLSRGNPNLAQDFSHNLFTHYSAVDVKNSTSFFAMIGGSYTQDYIGNSTIIAERDTVLADGLRLLKGAQLSEPANLDGQMSLRSFISYGLPVDFLKSNLNFTIMGTLSRTPGRINNEINYATSPAVMFGVVLGSNISENLDFTISSNSTLTSVSNTLQARLNNEFFNQSTGLRLNWIFWEGFSLQTDLNHQYNSGLSQGFNQNFVLWNASLGKKFLKDNAAEIRLYAFDILQQNNSVQRNITDVYVEDTRSNVLQQYFMVQFNYTLRNFSGQ